MSQAMPQGERDILPEVRETGVHLAWQGAHAGLVTQHVYWEGGCKDFSREEGLLKAILLGEFSKHFL